VGTGRKAKANVSGGARNDCTAVPNVSGGARNDCTAVPKVCSRALWRPVFGHAVRCIPLGLTISGGGPLGMPIFGHTLGAHTLVV